MATILEFTRSGAPQREQPRSGDTIAGTGVRSDAGAEIIIFPGVRYEHWGDTEETGCSRIAIETGDDIDAAPNTRLRASATGRASAATRKKPRSERKRDILEIPD